MSTRPSLLSVAEAARLIEAGRTLLVAGDEALLDALPRGRWIGGTIPYFMGDDGGLHSRDLLHVAEIPGADAAAVRWYDEQSIAGIAADAPDNGLTVCILPAGSAVHEHYAHHAPDFEDMFAKPLIGWVAGVDLADLGRLAPRTFNGTTGQTSDRWAVALHVRLPDDLQAVVEVLNLFEASPAHTVVFDSDGFSAGECTIDGRRGHLARFIADRGLDARMPLVADYNGFGVNVSIQDLDAPGGTVHFYAPVFAGVEYRFARPVADYVGSFGRAMQGRNTDAVFSCNCILNYVHAGLQGQRTGTLTGPMTFGEIAWQLLNQTLVWARIEARPA